MRFDLPRRALSVGLVAAVALVSACTAFSGADGGGGGALEGDAASDGPSTTSPPDGEGPDAWVAGPDGGDGGPACDGDVVPLVVDDFENASGSGWTRHVHADGARVAVEVPPEAVTGQAIVATAIVTDGGQQGAEMIGYAPLDLYDRIDLSYDALLTQTSAYAQLGCSLWLTEGASTDTSNRFALVEESGGALAFNGDRSEMQVLDKLGDTKLGTTVKTPRWYWVDVRVRPSSVAGSVDATMTVTDATTGVAAGKTITRALVRANLSHVMVACGVHYAGVVDGTVRVAVDNVKATLCRPKP